MIFRKEINGLRAIAVIAVVLFHFNASWMPGGFAGVDVFFVISGFLMTGIIFSGIEQGNFSILRFYVARANRIIPALAVLSVVLLVLGWFFLNPIDYKTLAKHTGSSLTFLSNVTYWRESGYFDASSHEKWLLHTWSLSVEWQFYLIYPLVLVAMRNFMSVKAMKATLLFGTLLGFIFCVIATYKWPNPAYYLLPTRAWEMMIGGVAYLYPVILKEERKKFLEWFGLALIIGSYLFISKNNPWPGYLALFPVLGSFLIIQAQRNDSTILNNIVFQKIGSWSYSIYLWHWPLVVVIYYFSLNDTFIYLGIALSVLLGYLSNKYIEKIKFRNDFVNPFDYLKCKPLYLVLGLACASFVVYKSEPNQYLYPLPTSVLKSFESGEYDCFDKDFLHNENTVFCKITDGKNKLFAFGDSHSYSSLPAVESISKDRGFELTYAGYSGCPPLINVYPKRSDQNNKNCNALNEKVINYIIENNYDYAFLAARWTYYTEGDYQDGVFQYLVSEESEGISRLNSISAFKKGLEATFEKYSKTKVKVIVMLQVPMQLATPQKVYYQSISSGKLDQELLDTRSVSTKKHLDFQRMTNEIIINVADKYKNVVVIDPTESFCSDKICSIGDVVKSYYFDDDHLSVYGNTKLKDFISNAIN
ncbi:acyltransferase [Shewanella sp. NKUCC01_JLK]|uniref:acyltransferase family protein n=1 Tax=Shewanella sp. NKUCC01_JLK TaxID=2842123 RepID=UPI001C5B7B07|nr:acyltransferase family protein [Shewanella sp. NKUCC01_JLK]MBW3516848.1 acyltransferase [Shewanella sp. NKUCC01_JLK]